MAPFPTSFIIPFVYEKPEHIKCFWRRPTDDEIFEERYWLTFGTDYIVTPIQTQDTGGTLTIITAIPIEAEQFVIRRVTPRTQTIDLHNGGKLAAELIESMANKAIMLIQEIYELSITDDDLYNIKIAFQNAILAEAQTRQSADESHDSQIKKLAAADINLNARIYEEQTSREQQINDAINNEANARQSQVNELREEINETNHVLEGVHTTSLMGATLTRVLGGTTNIPINLFDPSTVFTAGKTLIFDQYGTTGVYIQDIDSATILVLTKSISPVSELEPTLLGSVGLFGDLPSTVTEAKELWGRTPRVDDYAQVMADDNFDGLRVEWYIINIDDQGNIIWGNPVPLNTADFQTQTTANMAGKVLTGGAAAGTFGDALAIDLEPAENSNNLVKSGGIFAWFGATLSTLKTAAKTVIGAINELFDTTVKTSGNQTIAGIKTFSSIPVLPSSNPTNDNQAVRKAYVDKASLYTFIIDSDAKLKQWADNAAGNDYSRVLVRAGTWTYNLGVISGGSRNVIDISNGRTKSIDAETGSRINISVSYTNNSPGVLFNALYGNQDITINNLSLYLTANISFSGDTYNITVLNNFNILNNCKIGLIVNLTNVYDISVSTFVISNCNRLYNCKNEYTLNGNTGTGDAYGVGFSGCNFLYSCIGTGQNGAFAGCRTGFGCRGIGSTAAQRSFGGCYMEQVSGNTLWANTAAGGYNYSGA